MIEQRDYFPENRNYPPFFIAQDLRAMKEGRLKQLTDKARNLYGSPGIYILDKISGLDKHPALDGTTGVVKWLPKMPWRRTAVIYVEGVQHHPNTDPTTTLHLKGLLKTPTLDMLLSDETDTVRVMPPTCDTDLFDHYGYTSVFLKDIDKFDSRLGKTYDSTIWDYYRSINWRLPVCLLAQFRAGPRGVLDKYWLLDILDLDQRGARRMIRIPKVEKVPQLNPKILNI